MVAQLILREVRIEKEMRLHNLSSKTSVINPAEMPDWEDQENVTPSSPESGREATSEDD